jgi:hypothetical protein
MVTIRRRVYISDNSITVTLTRLKLDVEKVPMLTFPLFGNVTVDSNKPWVGRIEQATGTFEIIQTNPYLLPLRFLEGNFFTLFIQGNVFDDGPKTKIEIDFNLGWRSLMILIVFFLFPIILLGDFVGDDNWEKVSGLIGWCLTFTIPGTLLLIYQLNSTDKKIKELLGVR